MNKQDTIQELDSITSAMIVCKTALNTVDEKEPIFSTVATLEHIIKRLNRLSEIISEDTDTNFHYIADGELNRIEIL